MTEIEESYREFMNEISLTSNVEGNFDQSIFFETFERVFSENGDIENLNESYYSGTGMEISGSSIDFDNKILSLSACDFREIPELQELKKDIMDVKFKHLENFYKKSKKNPWYLELEDTSAPYNLALTINESAREIERVRCILFSNAKNISRKQGYPSKEIDGKMFSYSVLDFGRYFDIENSDTGFEPIEIEMDEFGFDPLLCLSTGTGSQDYMPFLVVLPGEFVADLYSEYGPRLLEQNVRTFLQIKIKANHLMLKTLQNAPERFFAYNNGLTATASELELVDDDSGNKRIKAIKNLQIVNGGQTTATISYARDKGVDLSKVFVQMKMTKIADKEKMEEFVPKISRYANTQTRIQDSDFFSNHPFHKEIERLSRRIRVNPKEESFIGGKWFYERAKGQYKEAKRTDPKPKIFLETNPLNQLIHKTDLAKFFMSFECKPHIVSKGAQFNFKEFAKLIEPKWEKNKEDINEMWYKEIIAKAIIFKEFDKAILTAKVNELGKSDTNWYDGDYKAQINTYSIAKLASIIKEKNDHELDLINVWEKQTAAGNLLDVLIEIAKQVQDLIQDPPPGQKNVTQYCKQLACWQIISDADFVYDEVKLDSCLKSSSENQIERKDAKKLQKWDDKLFLEAKFFGMKDEEWNRIIEFSKKNQINTVLEEKIMRRIKWDPSKASKKDLKKLGSLLKLIDEFEFESWLESRKNSASSF